MGGTAHGVSFHFTTRDAWQGPAAWFRGTRSGNDSTAYQFSCMERLVRFAADGFVPYLRRCPAADYRSRGDAHSRADEPGYTGTSLLRRFALTHVFRANTDADRISQ